MNHSISIRSASFTAEELEQQLRTACEDQQTQLTFKLLRYRSIDTTTLVAIVGASGTAVGALITGILRFAEQRVSEKIVLVGRTGRRVEFPKGASDDEVRQYVELAKDLDLESIELQ